MSDYPLLSICIPTFNRGQILKTTLESIVSDPVFQETDKVEIVISDNCSTDDTQEVCRPFVEQFPGKVRYKRLEKPITGDENFIVVLNEGRGKYLKLNNDQLFFLPEAIGTIVDFLETREVGNVIFFDAKFSNNTIPLEKNDYIQCNNLDELFKKISYMATWIGGLCVLGDAYRQIKEPGKFSHLQFGQIYIMSELLARQGKCTVILKKLMEGNSSCLIRRNYDYFKIFGYNLRELLNNLVQEKRLKNSTKNYIMKKNIHNINFKFYTETKWTLANFIYYFRMMLPLYWNYFAFYYKFPIMLVSPFVEKYLCKREGNVLKLEIFGKIIKSRIIMNGELGK